MCKLLSADLARLRRDRIFYICLACTFLLALAAICNGAGSVEKMRTNGFERSLDPEFFGGVPYLGAVYAGFISLFLGAERGDGVLRNKLIVGNSRFRVYLSGFLACFLASLCLTAAWVLGSLPGLWLIGPFEMGGGELFWYFLTMVGFSLSFYAMYTWMGMLTDNKAFTVVISILIWLVLLLTSSAFYDRLCEPEMTYPATVFADGALVSVEGSPNPLYLQGKVRQICQCVLELLPTGQTMILSATDLSHPLRQFLFSLLWAAVSLLGGTVHFQRKNLK